MIGSPGSLRGRGDDHFETYFATIGVDTWDDQLPQTVIPFGGDGQAEALLLVVFGIHLTISWQLPPAWQVCWSWWEPDRPGTCELLNWHHPITLADGERLMAALDALRRQHITIGRPPSVTTLTRDEFLERLSRAKAEFADRHGRNPYDTELVPALGLSESTFKRYKKRWISDLRVSDTS
jgi:hypothetical protein